jgi:protein-disulfide isomerase
MRKEIWILGAIMAVVIVGAIVGSNYYRTSIQSERVTGNNNPTAPKINPEQLVRPDSWTLGPADAKVTLVEFYDPECEACAAFHPVVKKLLKDYEGKIRLVARYMPLHPNSLSAATFTEAAGEQGKYWQAQELLFQRQQEWGQKHGAAAASAPPVNFNALFDGYARELGLDRAKASAAVAENRYGAKIERDKKDGQALGVRRTPTFFVNGRELIQFGEAPLRQLIDDELKK